MNADAMVALGTRMRLLVAVTALAQAAGSEAAPVDPPVPLLPPVVEDSPQDGTPAQTAAPRSVEWQLGWRHLEYRVMGAAPGLTARAQVARAAVDLRLQWDLAPDWRAAWSSRLELVANLQREAGAAATERDRHSLREAWASWRRDQAQNSTFFDLGRINVRLGSASGFNPTDVLKVGAAREDGNADPRALRLDRLGVWMLRGQQVTPSGSLTVALMPRLTRRDTIDTRTFALALERTNGSAAGLLKWSPQWSEALSVDGTVYRSEGREPQFGLSASWLALPSAVMYAEWAGGRRVGLAGPQERAPAPSWHDRLSAGGTYTAPAGWEIGAELQHAADALSRDDWQRWRAVTSPVDLQRFAQLAQRRAYEREPLVRTGLFARAAWRRAFDIAELNLGGFMQVNAYDRSRLWQVRADWKLSPHWALTAITGAADGAADSEFGAYNPRRHVSVFLAYLH